MVLCLHNSNKDTSHPSKKGCFEDYGGSKNTQIGERKNTRTLRTEDKILLELEECNIIWIKKLKKNIRTTCIKDENAVVGFEIQKSGQIR